MAATERPGRSILAIVARRTPSATCVRGNAIVRRTRIVKSGCADLIKWSIPTNSITAGSAGRGWRQIHRLQAECAKSHRFAPHHEVGASAVALAAVVTYEAPGRQR